MKITRKVIVSVLIAIFAIMLCGNINVIAVDNTMWIKPVLLRKADSEQGNYKFGYYYGAASSQSNSNAKYVWKLVTTDQNGTVNDATSYNKTIYCLKAGVGFYTQTIGNFIPEKYTISEFDDKDKIINILNIPESNYNSIMWILNNAYTPDKGESYRDSLLAKVKEEYSNDRYWGVGTDFYDLTDDDIDVIQQIAIWQFTDNDDYKIEGGRLPALQIVSGITNDVVTSGEPSTFNEYDRVNGTHKEQQAAFLYNYLIENAEAAKEQEQQNTEDSAVEIVNKENIVYEDGKIGPIQLSKKGSIDSQVDLKILGSKVDSSGSQTEISDYKLYTKNGSNYVEVQKQNGKYNIEELIGKQIYVELGSTVEETLVTIKLTGTYTKNKFYFLHQVNSSNMAYQPLVDVEYEEVEDEDTVNVTIEKPEIDLALRKSITKIADQTRNDRLPNQITDNLYPRGNKDETAKYNHPKNDLEVCDGDTIEYTLTIFNEGEVNAGASEIKDYLPQGIIFDELTGNNSLLYTATTESTLRGTTVTITAKDKNSIMLDKYTGANKTAYTTITLKCHIDARNLKNDTRLVNIAEITKYYDGQNELVSDRDSEAGNFPDSLKNNKYNGKGQDGDYIPGQQDDDDFEPVVLKELDLALRKSITKIGDDSHQERLPEPNTTNLVPKGNDTTAKYNHPKDALLVDVDDEIKYTLTIFNEGFVDAYAKEIKDYLPKGIQFVKVSDEDVNRYTIQDKKNSDGTTELTITHKAGTSPKVIENYAETSGSTRSELDYDTVSFICKVTDDAEEVQGGRLVNIAEITKYYNAERNKEIDRDRDSEIDNFPDNLKNNQYNGNGQDGNYIPGQQDDDDFEPVVLQKHGFDLALRKFITQVNGKVVNPDRTPQFSGQINPETDSWRYDHTKEPVQVKSGDIVTYKLRIYNEGEINGYAEIVDDDLPDGIEFLPNNQINKDYRWKMYDENDMLTTDVTKAKRIKTDYLSKAYGETRMQDEGLRGNPNLLEAFDQDTMDEPDYRDIEIAFKVTELNSSDRTITNEAQIVDDADEQGDDVDDVDSTPDEWLGEDDEDVDHIILQEFDLALRKWVNQVIVIEDGKQTVMNTGHKAEDDPEEVVKVELPSKKLDSMVVKFAYKIKVTNEGKIAGTVDEITDYIPEGLEFGAGDNPRWTEKEENIIATRYAGDTPLSDIILQPGDTVTVDVVLTWINGEDNLDLKVNTAEISADSDDDIDSTPGNKVEGEDDIDDAPVILSVATGIARTYIGLITVVLVILMTGIILIRKYIL